MARQERGVRTRHAVLAAAAAVFAERGYAAATIAEILKRARVTKGALYFHFDSKADLARGVLEEQLSPEYLLPRELKLQEWVDAGMVLARRLPREPLLLAGVRISADLPGNEVLGSAWPAWARLTSGVLADAKERGEVLPHVVPEETAQVFLGAWIGVQFVSQTAAGWTDLADRTSALYGHLLPAIAAPDVLPRLDTAPDRGARVIAEARQRPAALVGATG